MKRPLKKNVETNTVIQGNTRNCVLTNSFIMSKQFNCMFQEEINHRQLGAGVSNIATYLVGSMIPLPLNTGENRPSTKERAPTLTKVKMGICYLKFTSSLKFVIMKL